MSPASPTYDALYLFRVPREVRFLELLILIGAYASCVQRPMTSLLRRINLLTMLFVAVAIVGLFPGARFDAERAQEIYIRVVPMLFFVVVATLGVTRRDVEALVRFFIVVTGISIVIAVVYQIPYHGEYEDNIHGLFSDAHILGTMVAILAVGCLSEYLETKRLRYLVWAGSLLVFSLYPGNGKVVLLSGAWFGLVLVKQYLLPRGWAARIAFGGLVLLGLALALMHFASKEDSPLRLFELSEFSVTQLGPIAAWPIAIGWLLTSSFTFLFGLGAGDYGWLAAFRAVSDGQGSTAAQTFSFEFSFENTRSAGFLFRTNTWSSLLAEFGIIGFILFLTAIAYIVRGVLQIAPRDRFERTMLRVITFAFVAVVFQGFFTPFSNWSESILMFPLMFIAAYFIGRDQQGAHANA